MSQPMLTHCFVEDDTSLVRFLMVFSLYTITPSQTWKLYICQPEMRFMCRRFKVGAKISAILITDWFLRVSYGHKIQVFIKSSHLHLIIYSPIIITQLLKRIAYWMEMIWWQKYLDSDTRFSPCSASVIYCYKTNNLTTLRFKTKFYYYLLSIHGLIY